MLGWGRGEQASLQVLLHVCVFYMHVAGCVHAAPHGCAITGAMPICRHAWAVSAFMCDQVSVSADK